MAPKQRAQTARTGWYRNGLAFECQLCGGCCSGPAEGYVWVTKQEIAKIANYLNLPEKVFIKRYCRRIGSRYSLIEKEPSKDCVFLRKAPSGQAGAAEHSDVTGPAEPPPGCDIYPVRPRQCRTWPFWPDNLRNPLSWRLAAAMCPGMDTGRWYAPETIRHILDGGLPDPPNTPAAGESLARWIEQHRHDDNLLNPIRELLQQLDTQIASLNPECRNCGSCCDFARHGHRLYVTTLEVLVFASSVELHQLTGRQRQAVQAGRCPFRDQQGCSPRTVRPTGCRIFFCQGIDQAFQNEMTEHVLTSLRELHESLAVPYCYMNWLEWLDQLGTVSSGGRPTR